MKTCKICNQEKPLTEYYLSKGIPRSYCKPCMRQKNTKWNKNHPDKYQKALNKFYKNNS